VRLRMSVLGIASAVLAAWSGPGPGAAALRYPAGVVVDDAGDVYVSDFFGNEIRKFTCD
jgi:hypothetical protein